MRNVQWFEGCSTIEQVRSKYRDLAKKHHPDVGGSNEDMRDINLAYTVATAYFTRKHNPERAETFYADLDAVNENIRIVILQLLRLKNIKIELIGQWVWVSGETRAVKEQLKSIGLMWSPKKSMWYYAGVPAKSWKNHSIDQIRSYFGSKVVEDEAGIS